VLLSVQFFVTDLVYRVVQIMIHIWVLIGIGVLLSKLFTEVIPKNARRVFYLTLLPIACLYLILLVHIAGLADLQFSPSAGFFYLSVWEILLVGGLLIINIRSITRKTAQYKNSLIEQQKNYVSAMVEAQELERKRLAIELHDGLGQVLSTARITLSSLEGELQDNQEAQLSSSIKLIDRAVSEIRSVSHSMMPTALVRENGLEPAIQEIIKQINISGKIQAEFSVNKHVELPDYVQINIYRIVQEIVNNIIRHSQATKIEIVMLFYETTAQLSISDNGTGIEIKTLEKGTGLGWRNIKNRVDILKGEISLISGKDSGSIIGIEFPIKFENKEKIATENIPNIPLKQGPIPDVDSKRFYPDKS
jgi:signal transduction histidine kinase